MLLKDNGFPEEVVRTSRPCTLAADQSLSTLWERLSKIYRRSFEDGLWCEGFTIKIAIHLVELELALLVHAVNVMFCIIKLMLWRFVLVCLEVTFGYYSHSVQRQFSSRVPYSGHVISIQCTK